MLLINKYSTIYAVASMSLFVSGAEYEEEVINVLKLPYAQEHVFGSADAKLPMIGSRIGIGGFAAISEIIQHQSSESEEHYTIDLCSSDLSLFKLDFSKPKSCRAACDSILQSVLGRDYSQMKGLIDSNKAELESERYTLTTSLPNFIRISRLDIRKAIMVRVVYMPLQQPLLSPASRDVVIAQMNALIDAVFALSDVDTKMTDDKEAYYKRIKEAYTETNNRTAVKQPSESAVKFGLILSEVPTQEQTENALSSGMKKSAKVIAQKPYLVSRVDGEAIPLVKIADPKSVNVKAEVTKHESDKSVAEAINDIQIQVSFQGNPSYFEATIRSDGKYEVRFYGVGKRMLRVSYFDESGEVVQFGEVEVDVVSNEAEAGHS